MDKDRLIEQLRAVRFPVQRSIDCPEASELAQFLDREPGDKQQRSLSAERLAALQTHLSDCPYCLQQVALVLGSHGADSAGASGKLLARAEALADRNLPPPPAWRWLWNTPLPTAAAVAAVVVLAVGLLVQDRSILQTPIPDSGAIPTTRYSDSQALNPQLLAPTDGAVIVPAEQVFRWTVVPGSRFYDIRLVDTDGELLLRERVEDTRWLVPDELGLKAGHEYFVRVDAYVDDAQFLSSEHILFSVKATE